MEPHFSKAYKHKETEYFTDAGVSNTQLYPVGGGTFNCNMVKPHL